MKGPILICESCVNKQTFSLILKLTARSAYIYVGFRNYEE
jgi:hypothetical protein